MSPHHSQPDAAAGGQMEVPQAVIAQAEAAATNSNPSEERQRHSEIASERTPAIHQRYA